MRRRTPPKDHRLFNSIDSIVKYNGGIEFLNAHSEFPTIIYCVVS